MVNDMRMIDPKAKTNLLYVSQTAFDQMQRIPTIDAEIVVRCKDCVLHGNCLTEDTFNLCRIENPFCCGGKRKEAEGDGG